MNQAAANDFIDELRLDTEEKALLRRAGIWMMDVSIPTTSSRGSWVRLRGIAPEASARVLRILDEVPWTTPECLVHRPLWIDFSGTPLIAGASRALSTSLAAGRALGSLVSLSLQGCGLDDLAFSELSRAIGFSPVRLSLQTLDLSCNPIDDDRCFARLVKMLRSLLALRKLDLSSCLFREFSRGLRGCTSSLTELNLLYNPMSGYAVFDAIGALADSGWPLQRLSIGYMYNNPTTSKAFYEESMSREAVNRKGVHCMRALARRPELTEFVLCGVPVAAESLLMLVPSTLLRVLKLDGCRLGRPGALALGDLLGHASCLEALHVRADTSFGDSAMLLFAGGLALGKSPLKTLQLSFLPNVTLKGLSSILSAVVFHPHLAELNLEVCGASLNPSLDQSSMDSEAAAEEEEAPDFSEFAWGAVSEDPEEAFDRHETVDAVYSSLYKAVASLPFHRSLRINLSSSVPGSLVPDLADSWSSRSQPPTRLCDCDLDLVSQRFILIQWSPGGFT